ncbi:YjcZ family sporulation protein [Cohnella sp. 56]
MGYPVEGACGGGYGSGAAFAIVLFVLLVIILRVGIF